MSKVFHQFLCTINTCLVLAAFSLGLVRQNDAPAARRLLGWLPGICESSVAVRTFGEQLS
jgi:hypothetical protein